MLNPITHIFQYDQHQVIIETGMIARQTNASVIITMDGTTILITVVAAKQIKAGQNFFPLSVHYQERTYAAGKFPGGFFRREGRPNEREIFISRLIDRPIRPLFPKRFMHDIQIVATVISVNPKINPDIVAIIGTSAALSLSDIPFHGPIGAARVGFINNKYVLNPTLEELTQSKLDLIVSGTNNSIIMVDAEAQLLDEHQMLGAIAFGYEKQQIVIDNINLLVSKIDRPKWLWHKKEIDEDLLSQIIALSEIALNKAYLIINKYERNIEINNIKSNTLNTLINQNKNFDENEIQEIFNNIEKKLIRERILKGGTRIDGRTKNMIRPLDARINILSRTHGSALFTRGETQALVTVTLGGQRDAQNIDEIIGDHVDRFILHYNFPPYCVGEIGILGSPKRREIGHGKLVKRGLLAVMPKNNEFPYTIRVVSEITESNGSSSMASICGASMALMDAGVPIKSAIAGIAMGLIKENNKFIILSDILGNEDHLGDMDFKVAGSYEGITVLQMDIKIMAGITYEIIREALYRAKHARIEILNFMQNTISSPKKEISKFAPRIYIIKINPDKIKNVIGKGGSVIKMLTEETDTIIEIEDDGTIKVLAINSDKASYAISRIEEITAEIKVGRIYYNSKVTRIVDFGAFVSIGGGKEGLVHISQISNKHVKKVADYLELGQKVSVKVIEIDRQGRVRLSIKEAIIPS